MADQPMADNADQAETGIIVTLLERMRTQRLPRALDLKAKVDAGGTLNDFDIQFLEEVFTDANNLKTTWERHPELVEIVSKLIHLHHEITTRALANEGGAQPT